jgi:hypothetical protein
MLKTLTAIAALAVLLAFNITPAQAALTVNGGGTNGAGQNGYVNNGGGNNGASEESSTLSIQAFELPAETR